MTVDDEINHAYIDTVDQIVFSFQINPMFAIDAIKHLESQLFFQHFPALCRSIFFAKMQIFKKWRVLGDQQMSKRWPANQQMSDQLARVA